MNIFEIGFFRIKNDKETVFAPLYYVADSFQAVGMDNMTFSDSLEAVSYGYKLL